METAKLFQNGKSQAVRLPKEFRFGSDRVYIKKVGNAVVLLPYQTPWETLLDSLSMFSPDFMDERNQPTLQNREAAFP
ncbi:MAG: AbrB/MazE/SpoVT family DNA-binding domain-containing protein [Chloroflexi bacterium]|nr:antitoxin [Chloroflexi bacterium CFX1]MCK6568581.1 antitoxin [Anaerolineales bacterium]MCQ3954767.1 AbrB/MazE/SpoVT family DNA-binding domain-containing protein [Chloroflexota bacterium]MDL1920401.1 antitoxin [Chloroflexi bacterium CFX5]NUQ58945.1 antitoxin [Anaerolineales bacterium]